MPRRGAHTLSPSDVANHLACEHRTQLERQRRRGERTFDFSPDARLEALALRGEQHEAAYVEQLRAAGRSIVDLSHTRSPADTLAAMRDAADVIVQAPLGSDAFFGIADVLERIDEPSDLGDHGYVPLDAKLAVETRAGALLQLLTYCELLGKMQGRVPERFFVVTPAAREEYRTDDYAAYFRVIRDHVARAHADEPAPATYPLPVPHCDICTYWRVCEQQREADDHPSLIADIRRGQLEELERQELPTLAAFARAGRLPAAPSRGRADTYERLAHQARLQLEARERGEVPVERLPAEAPRGFHRLPPPSSGDLFLDFEGDPFVGRGGLEYLTGWIRLGDDGEPVYEQLWALDHGEEKHCLERFLDHVAARLEKDPNLHVYHFGAYEVTALRRLCNRHDTRGDVLDMLLRGERFVNLHAITREALRVGVRGYGLKQLEPVIGYRRTLDLRDASAACRDVELALELDRRAAITDEMRARVADYNRDDCLATRHLRDWLEAQRAAAIADGADIPRPRVTLPAAPENVRQNSERIEELRTSLLAGLPPEAERDDVDRGKALLADLVGYFLRERKTAWWEHFRLRELPAEERLDDREMVAGLTFDGIRPREGRETSTRVAYRFPPQELSTFEGKKLYTVHDEDTGADGAGTVLGTAVEVDAEAGVLVVKQGKATRDLRPTAAFRDQVVSNAALERGLLELAEHVRDHGFVDRGPYARACDLLLRRRPTGPTPDADGRLAPADEPALAACKRLCAAMTGGVLPVQGPPGSGKSFTGSRTIAELVRSGRTVGVTAVSHEVIDNLLRKVHDAAAAAGFDVRLLHKDKVDGVPPGPVEYTNDNDEALAAIAPGAVVGGTAWLWARADASERLDYLFVDEAGQMSLAQVLAFARAAHNLVLLGDPQQLEQPRQGAHPDGADVAALTHLIGVDNATLDDDRGLFLPKTWRLPPSICEFTSELYYENRLTSVTGCDGQCLLGTGFLDGAGMFRIEVSHAGNQASSDEEVAAVRDLVDRLLRSNATWTDRSGERAELTAEHVLVIAPYNAQVAALRQALRHRRDVRVGTVDKFQGKEAPVVIYSCTSSSPADAPRGLEFLYDPHRLNVATSRAQCAFVMVASPALFLPEVKTPGQMRRANGMCKFRELSTPLATGTED